ncbi:MAG: arylesterase [Pseudomonadota bacterium]
MICSNTWERMWRYQSVGVRGAVVAMLASVAVSIGAPASAGEPIKIVAFGDSLVAGYGLSAKAAFPTKLEAALKAKGHDVTIINAGVSGDTTAAGRARFDWAVPDNADAVILELGANDALRGISVKQTRENLTAILDKLKTRNVPVLLAGMKAPANWGKDYQATFDGLFPKLANQFDAILYPFFLEGVVLDAKLNQADGMHPNAAGVDVIVERILPQVEELVARAKQSANAG